MNLENKIDLKLSEALKNKDKNVYPTLRLVVSAIKDVKIQKKVKEGSLKDEEVIGVLKKMIKQRNDSCEAYKKAGRDDLLNNEKNEIKIISEFLPNQLHFFLQKLYEIKNFFLNHSGLLKFRLLIMV